MPSSYTPPSFHEDQPSALETTLASQVAGHNQVGAMAMLIPEAQRRYQAQGNYHDYMAQINEQQLANLANTRNENTLKAVESANAHPISGFLPWAVGNGLMPGGPGIEGYNQGYNTAASANVVEHAGSGLGKLMEAGAAVTPSAIGQFIPPAGGQPPVTAVNPPALVQAAQTRGAYDLAGKSMGNDMDKTQVDLPTDPTSPLGLAGGKTTLRGRAATDYINSHQGNNTPQISPAAKNQALAKLHAEDPAGWKDVMDGGARIVRDPSAPQGMSFLGKSGRMHH